MPPPNAQWTTKNNEITTSVVNGTLTFKLPLYDNNVRQGWLELQITATRIMKITWEEVAGAEGLADFQAWWKEA